MTAPNKVPGCIFCVAHASEQMDETLALYRNLDAVVMLNRYPYSNGHLMVSPSEHHARLFETSEETLGSLMRLTAESQRILSQVYGPEGFNIGMNFGEVAGAGVADHYHIHVVPRWGGDTNFMSVTAKTRLVPEALEVTYSRLKPEFDKLSRREASHA